MDEISDFERDRVRDLISAAVSADWERFSQLSEGGFINSESMKEQFDTSILELASYQAGWERRMSVSVVDDGTRVIDVALFSKVQSAPPVNLIIHSTNDTSLSKISVWVFYPEPTFG